MVTTSRGWSNGWLNLCVMALVVAASATGCKASVGAPAHSASSPPASSPSTSPAGATAKTATQPTPSPTVATRPATFADIVAKVRPAVVNIYTRKEEVVARRHYDPFFGAGVVPQRRIAESLGSGFIIDHGGHVLTNYHVVKDATAIGVRLLDDRFFEAKIVGADPKSDVALLQIQKGKNLPVIPLGDAHKLRVGDWVVAIGNPLGLTSTVTAGITSAIGRQNIPINEDMRYQDFIQTDASINPGNSGGPLINTRGEVVGINTAISAKAQGIGFAIPINMATEILPQLEKTGHVERSWLGIYVDQVPRKVHQELGLPQKSGAALVTRVVPGGPAEAAHLKRGDILLSIDGKPIEDAGHLAWMASTLGIGKTVDIVYWRDDARRTAKLTLGALPE